MQVEYSVKPSLRRRLNLRLIVFLSVICIPFAWMFITFVQEETSGGIENHGNFVEVNLKALGQFPFNEETGLLTDIPKRYRELDGKRVELKGFMWAGMTAANRATRCQLVWNIQRCCFNGPPQVQERVFLQAPSGRSMRLYDYGTLVSVVGKLRVQLKKNELGTITSVYELVPDTVQQAQ